MYLYSGLQNGCNDCHSTHNSPLNSDLTLGRANELLLRTKCCQKWDVSLEVSCVSHQLIDMFTTTISQTVFCCAI